MIFFPKNTTEYLQPLDLLIFSVLKSQYRKWLSQLKLMKIDVNEEKAVCKILEIYQNLSEGSINKSWQLTGLAKFKNLQSNQSDQLESVSDEQIQDDLNERLEELEIFGEE